MGIRIGGLADEILYGRLFPQSVKSWVTIEHSVKARGYGVNLGGGSCAGAMRWGYTRNPGGDHTFRMGEDKGDCDMGRRENPHVVGEVF